MLEKPGRGKSGRDTVPGTHKGQKVEYLARRLVVRLSATESEKSLSDAIEGVLSKLPGARVLRGPGSTGRMLVLINERENMEEIARRISKVEGVRWAEPDMLERMHVIPSDPQYPNQWAPPLVN